MLSWSQELLPNSIVVASYFSVRHEFTNSNNVLQQRLKRHLGNVDGLKDCELGWIQLR